MPSAQFLLQFAANKPNGLEVMELVASTLEEHSWDVLRVGPVRPSPLPPL